MELELPSVRKSTDRVCSVAKLADDLLARVAHSSEMPATRAQWILNFKHHSETSPSKSLSILLPSVSKTSKTTTITTNK